MKLAHIVPISLLDCVPKNQRTHLAISELVLLEKRYRDFYANKLSAGHVVILDNPVHEDKPISLDRWLQAAYVLQPTIAVIPDVIDSDAQTIRNAEAAISTMRKSGLMRTELMAVPHGETQLDWLYCAKRLAEYEEISWLGLSLERRLADDMYALTRRRERVQFLLDEPEIFGRMSLHLLGLSENCTELGDDKIWRRASSVDTSKFAVWGMSDMYVGPPVPVPDPYPGRYSFGGSYGYFFTGHPSGLSRRKFRNHLHRWSSYADREQ